MAHPTRASGPASDRAHLYQQITDRIIADLEAGRVPSVQPWGTSRAAIGMPHNAFSERRYSGINVLSLWHAVVSRGFSSHAFLTFRQAVALGGSAMSAFFELGDVILNPFDRRCARWDLLSEIERSGDHAFVAQSLLPHLGIGEHDQWISYAQQLLAAALENFGRLGLGTTSELITMLASGSVAELKLLCQGTAAARYFEQGGEKMLASILGTLVPAVGNLRFIAELDGEPFSIRKWVRSGAGSLWLPYTANQVAALRGLISCWMNIAILETLSLAPDRDRRIWFHIDELDALGRIEGLRMHRLGSGSSAAVWRSASNRRRRSKPSMARGLTRSSRTAGICFFFAPVSARAAEPPSSPRI